MASFVEIVKSVGSLEDLFFVVGNHSPSEQYSKQITSLEIFKSLNRRELVNFGFSPEEAVVINLAVQRFESRRGEEKPVNNFTYETGKKRVNYATNIEIKSYEGESANVTSTAYDVVTFVDMAPLKPGFLRKTITPSIFMAASLGDIASVDLLFRHSRDINERNQCGWTPLMFACQKGFEELVQYLLRRNASLDIQNDKGQTALMLASGWGHASCAQYLIDHKMHRQDERKRNLFPKHLLHNRKAGFRSFINAVDVDGWTALHHAVLAAQTSCIDLLVRNGASLNIVSKDGLTPFALAVKKKRSDEVMNLLTRARG